MPLNDLAENKQPGAFGGGAGFCRGKLRELPYHQGLGLGEFRSHLHGIPADEWPRECALRFLPHEQQLQFDDRADGLRKLGMPFDEMAADHNSRTLDVRFVFCSHELRELPYHERLGLRFFRPQCDGLHPRQRHAPPAT
jgi:hypothetical protein